MYSCETQAGSPHSSLTVCVATRLLHKHFFYIVLYSFRGPGDSNERSRNRGVDELSCRSPPNPGISLGGQGASRGPSSSTLEGTRQVRHKTTLPVEAIRSPAYVYQTNEVNIIRRELDSNSSLSTSRRHVLESALSLIGDFSNPSHSVESSSYDQELDDGTPDNVGLPELFFMMMNRKYPASVPSEP